MLNKFFFFLHKKNKFGDLDKFTIPAFKEDYEIITFKSHIKNVYLRGQLTILKNNKETRDLFHICDDEFDRFFNGQEVTGYSLGELCFSYRVIHNTNYSIYMPTNHIDANFFFFYTFFFFFNIKKYF